MLGAAEAMTASAAPLWGGARIHQQGSPLSPARRHMQTMSTIYTPFSQADACEILEIASVEYQSAVMKSKLNLSWSFSDDPLSRFRFHSYWDLCEFAMRQYLELHCPAESISLIVTSICDLIAEGSNHLVSMEGTQLQDSHVCSITSNVQDRFTDPTVPQLPYESVTTILMAIHSNTLNRCIVHCTSPPRSPIHMISLQL